MQALGILRDYLSIKREERLDRDSLEELQKKKLSRMLDYASQTDHYGRIMAENSIRPSDILGDLTSIPITEKQDVHAAPTSLIPRPIKKGSLFVFTTSGSTGIPMKIYGDQQALNFRIALVYAHEIAQGRSPSELFAVIARELYVPQHPFLAATGLFRKLYLSANTPEEKNYDALCKSKAKVFKTYPSVLTILSKLNNQENKKMKLRSIISTGEMLSKNTRKLAEESFSCPVYDHYGVWETRSVGWECPEERNLHVNGSSCILEIVDENGKPKKTGVGDIIITSLHNKAMPFIRYRVGDRGSLGKDCPCGRGYPVLKELEGRTSEFIVLPSGKIHSASALGISRIESFFADVLQYQIIQEKEDLFVVKYTGKELSSETEKEAIKMIRESCNEDVQVEFEHVASIKRGRTGKISRIICKVKPKRAL